MSGYYTVNVREQSASWKKRGTARTLVDHKTPPSTGGVNTGDLRDSERRKRE